MLTAEEKQRLLAEIKKTCRGQCTFAAGVKYTYGSVGVILENLQEPFAPPTAFPLLRRSSAY